MGQKTCTLGKRTWGLVVPALYMHINVYPGNNRASTRRGIPGNPIPAQLRTEFTRETWFLVFRASQASRKWQTFLSKHHLLCEASHQLPIPGQNKAGFLAGPHRPLCTLQWPKKKKMCLQGKINYLCILLQNMGFPAIAQCLTLFSTNKWLTVKYRGFHKVQVLW